jgi:hypothetical protein
MKKLFNSKKKTLITYSIIMVVITLISFLFLLLKIYEATMVLAISTVSNFLYLFLILYYGSDENKKVLAKGKGIFLFTIMRSLIVIASLTFSAISLLFTKNELFEQKYRMLFILITLVPYFMAIGAFNIYSKLGENNDSSQDSK